MKKKQKTVLQIVITAVILIAIIFTVWSSLTKDKDKIAQVGDDAPLFELQTVDGKKVNLKDLRGKGVLINFWGTWCEPCKREMPELERQYQNYKDKGVEVVAIHVRNNPQQIKQYLSSLKETPTFTVAMDNDNLVTDAYGINPLPTTITVDKDGKIKTKHTGELSKKQIIEEMEKVKVK
ncbi:thiol-disulfide oxidoreductase ResA [Mammaliicoccus sciuri]|uniref:thiol-disulfide oxidoreductase ResA n=1 Tax=Mammaliicoccus sciuri TaxID=1296 RepID=UPI001E42CAB1|nr:thiol-disulfide oxidoreductase ResA [Mammaliicoccus sciuri]MCD8801885.1 thiol-disulfide oxidoreductase ResA [Mammaliicoccus sciuri]MCY1047974.1 thiol-disulfide oxidoreductase ResA [Mammaliicoccus sciuri]MCY1051015.1 thiol-disulfide oxidoreductase ResA [Mammaliicoccus sciuri]